MDGVRHSRLQRLLSKGFKFLWWTCKPGGQPVISRCKRTVFTRPDALFYLTT